MISSSTGKKVVDAFTGELYFVNDDEIKRCLDENCKPSLTDYFGIEKFSLIEDSINQNQFLLGDFKGDGEYYGFTLKVFLYQKDKKALGSLKYVVEAKEPYYHINGSYRRVEDMYVVYGFMNTDGKEGKEGFILFAERPKSELIKELPRMEKAIVKEKPIQRASRTKTNIRAAADRKKREIQTGSQKKGKERKTTETPAAPIISNEESILDYFADLDGDAEKEAFIHFVSYVLIKIGYQVQQLQAKKARPDLLLEYNGNHYFVYLFVSSDRKPTWKVNVKGAGKSHFFIFCHALPNDFVPDVYIVDGLTLAKWMKKRTAINIDDKEMTSIKNSWSPVLE